MMQQNLLLLLMVLAAAGWLHAGALALVLVWVTTRL
jgi:hypothetical protein